MLMLQRSASAVVLSRLYIIVTYLPILFASVDENATRHLHNAVICS